MRYQTILLMLLIPISAFSYDIKQLRLDFYNAVNNKKAADDLAKKLQNENLNNSLLLAYYGSVEAVKAKHAWNPYQKIVFLKKGTKNLDDAVKKSSDNLEIRFLRFSLEHYIPSFLGYNKHLESDRKRIVELIQRKTLGSVDANLLKHMVAFLKESGRCTSTELAILNKAV